MNCLRDYIGLRYCGNTTTPPSGLYVNDLTGISLRQLTSLTDEESATFTELWNTIQTRAESRFAVDVRDAMGSKYKISTLNQAVNMGRGIESTSASAPSNMSGFVIELVDPSVTEFIPSALTYISLQTLQFYADASDAGETKTVAIFDTLTGATLFTTTVTLTTGWNVVQVNTKLTGSFNSLPNRVFCGITSSALTVYDMDTPDDLIGTGCCQARIRGAYSSQTTGITSDELTYTGNTYGLSATFSVQCAWDGMVCQNKDIFARPYWYCLGVELLTEQMYSTKLNSYTTIDKMTAAKLRDEFIIEYNKSLSQICDNMELDCDCCIECSGSVMAVTSNQFY